MQKFQFRTIKKNNSFVLLLILVKNVIEPFGLPTLLTGDISVGKSAHCFSPAKMLPSDHM